ncbi:DUF5317 family protein [Streptomyces sp. NK08204]|uniref:DUF5317 family protein n=1 Tax=Streptomyces sp. NK08204 TaxID=2873260 RepID=UPI001CEC20DB|nr:DUF5317 family protein [Streptomyces sp. NK08204]
MAVAVGGALLNALASAADGRMPYGPCAAAAAGPAAGPRTAKNVSAGHTVRLLALGDTIPVPALHAVISIGDILLAASAVLLISTAMHHNAQPRTPATNRGHHVQHPHLATPDPYRLRCRRRRCPAHTLGGAPDCTGG